MIPVDQFWCLITSDELGAGVFGLGALVLVLITLLHGIGLDRIVSTYKAAARKLRTKGRRPITATFGFGWAIFLMLMLHVFEICIWAVVVNGLGLIPRIRDAVYFCANSYTTIGEGKMLLPSEWRELSPIMAISGLFTFGWTTSVMFNIVGDHRNLLEELQKERHKTSVLPHETGH